MAASSRQQRRAKIRQSDRKMQPSAQDGASAAQTQPTKAGTRISSHNAEAPLRPCPARLESRSRDADSPIGRAQTGDDVANSVVPGAPLYSQAWLLVIQSEFQSVEDRDALISHVKAVAVESACNEPQTLGFQVCQRFHLNKSSFSIGAMRMAAMQAGCKGCERAVRHVTDRCRRQQSSAHPDLGAVRMSPRLGHLMQVAPAESACIACRSCCVSSAMLQALLACTADT